MKLLIRGGRVVDPSQRIDQLADLFVRDGKIGAILKPGSPPPSAPERVVDASGAIVSPGFIDLHTHLREPGQTDKEDIESGTRAAVAGGFTSILCMPNTSPTNDTPDVTRFILERARNSGRCRVFPVGAVTKGLKGESLSPMGALKKAGCVAFSDDGRPINNAKILRRALEEAKGLDVPLIEHCEEILLSPAPTIHRGEIARQLGFVGVPSAAETVDAARAILLAAETGARVHLGHISSAESVSLLKSFRPQIPGLTAEVTPHHLMLTEEAVEKGRTNAKMYPPLRTFEDRAELRSAVANGWIDAIATDHAPHTRAEKERPFEESPNGVIGLETALTVLLPLVSEGVLSLSRLVEVLSMRPAQIAGLVGGTLRKGTPADITVFTHDEPRVVNELDLRSKSGNTPFIGFQGRGRVLYTFVDGRQVFPET